MEEILHISFWIRAAAMLFRGLTSFAILSSRYNCTALAQAAHTHIYCNVSCPVQQTNNISNYQRLVM